MLEEGARPAERKGLAVTPSAILLLCLLLPFPSPRHRCSWQTLLILLSAQPKIHRKVRDAKALLSLCLLISEVGLMIIHTSE